MSTMSTYTQSETLSLNELLDDTASVAITALCNVEHAGLPVIGWSDAIHWWRIRQKLAGLSEQERVQARAKWLLAVAEGAASDPADTEEVGLRLKPASWLWVFYNDAKLVPDELAAQFEGTAAKLYAEAREANPPKTVIDDAALQDDVDAELDARWSAAVPKTQQHTVLGMLAFA